MQMPDQGCGKIYHSAGYSAVSQEVTGQYKERDGHDLELFNAGEQLESHSLHRHLGHGKEKGQYRQAESYGNRHAGKHENRE